MGSRPLAGIGFIISPGTIFNNGRKSGLYVIAAKPANPYRQFECEGFHEHHT